MKENEKKPTGAGKSSFDLIDSDKLFHELDLQKGISFLDVASGRGAYSLAVSDIIGPQGNVFAVDLWSEGIEMLKNRRPKKGELKTSQPLSVMSAGEFRSKINRSTFA